MQTDLGKTTDKNDSDGKVLSRMEEQPPVWIKNIAKQLQGWLFRKTSGPIQNKDDTPVTHILQSVEEKEQGSTQKIETSSTTMYFVDDFEKQAHDMCMVKICVVFTSLFSKLFVFSVTPL